MESVDVCVELENDEFYGAYLRGEAGAAGGAADVERLAAGVERLNTHLERQVLLRHSDLLTRASHAADLDSELDAAAERARGLLRGAGALRASVTLQHDALRRHTRDLERALATLHLLRHAARILALRAALPAAADPARQAVLLCELDQLFADYDPAGIQLLDEARLEAAERQARLLADAAADMQASLLSGDRARLLACFRVLHNLRRTQEQTDAAVAGALDRLRRGAAAALSPPPARARPSPGRAGGVATISSAEIKTRLWDNLEKFFKNEVRVECSKIIMLQTVLNELHAIGKFRNIARTFWDNFCSALAEEIERSPAAVGQCIETDYPKLLKCFNDLLGGLKCKELAVRRERLSRWENAFLSAALGRLLEAARAAWGAGAVPGADQLDAAVRAVAGALGVSLGDRQLGAALAAGVATCVKQMSAEAEQRLSVDADAAQIVAPPTAAQQRNVDVCNALHYFSSQVSRVLGNMASALPAESAAAVAAATTAAGGPARAVLAGLAASVGASLQLILLTMHDEPELRRAEPPARAASCSPYMKELQQFISRCKEIYLDMFADKAAVLECCGRIAGECVDKFIQHAVTVRPLSEPGRARLRQDCRQLEAALGPLVADAGELGAAHRRLRALDAWLAMSAEEVAASALDSALPASYAALLLFGHAGPALESPGAAAGWGAARLVRWLDAHDERDRLTLVASALQRYSSAVRRQHVPAYDPVYPLLVALVEDARKKL